MQSHLHYAYHCYLQNMFTLENLCIEHLLMQF